MGWGCVLEKNGFRVAGCVWEVTLDARFGGKEGGWGGCCRGREGGWGEVRGRFAPVKTSRGTRDADSQGAA